ncbi:hypothetical protein [Peribacillus simplex]|uniref:hypothetical protein n=1 Tax=Peribacillus simplex TaxID=1478 RepID=UPI003D9C5285
MISIKEAGNLPGLRERAHKHSRQLLGILTKYFNTMHEGGKLIHTDPELKAFSFMKMNFGAFMNNLDDHRTNQPCPWRHLLWRVCANIY